MVKKRYILVLLFLLSNLLPEAQTADKVPNRKEFFSLNQFYSKSIWLDSLVTLKYNLMSVNERVAQMIMPAISSNNFGLPPAKALDLYKREIVGGFLFLKGSTAFFKKQFDSLNVISSTNNLLPALISADAEAALMHYKFVGMDKMKAAETQNTIAAVENSSTQILEVLKATGIAVNFAPVVDNNINRAIIKNRSFGSTAAEIVPKAKAFVLHHQKRGVAATIKHFPGHGAVSGDSHKGLVEIDGELTEIENFKEVLKSKPIGVMVGHIAVENNAQWGTNGKPATLSKKITTELLKENLDFDGIIYTDALNMGAVSKIKGASYQAACAGADVLLMPMDTEVLHTAIKKELSNKGQYAKQFEASIKKIIKLKYCLGLIE
jgi:beta-N-acetylhexosaminidase